MKSKLIRITTVPSSLKILLKGQHSFMSEYYDVIGISSKGEDLDEVKKIEGIETIAVEMTRTITPFKDLQSVWKLYRVFRRERPKIVHTHTPKAGIVGMLAAKLAGVPIRLHTVAGLPLLEASGLKRFLLNSVEKLTYSCATKVYPNSVGLFNIILEQKFCKKEKLMVISNGSSNGMDIHYFNPAAVSNEQQQTLKKDLQIKPNDFVFIFIGRLVGDKGINELITSFRTISNSHKNCKLLLVGASEPELDPLSSETISIMNENKDIIEVGFQKDVRPYLSISNALVFPTYREGFPNVVLQACAMGLPAIVTDINGCNEIIMEGKNGTIIAPKDIDALTNAMQKFLEEKERWQDANSYRKTIVDRFQQEIVWNALLAEYKTLEAHVC
ncbi:MAG: glycosyltransferase family 1 protein [Flavobacteriaceae bacterium]|nr:glycosyltransferase family 1 protein [Flavobacteriaceae bacterium]|tara:strand:+ start:425 stop:1582 length:1158 start_codon:yes stop_codon:yes gene_type:complete